MNNVFLITIIILLIVLIALVLVLLLRKNDSSQIESKLSVIQNSQETAARLIADEFGRSRTDTTAYQQALREETSAKLKEISDALREMTKANFEQNERQNKVVASSMAAIQESNEKKLDEMRQTVDEKLTATLNSRLDSSFKTVSDQLENVYKSLGEVKELSSGVTTNVSALNRVLTNVKARGTWAEVQLESILDQTIPNMYVKNYSPTASGEVVEFAIKIPSGEAGGETVYLPVDSKFPMEDYIRICDAADASDPEALAEARKALEKRILTEGKNVAKYIHIPHTTPFAIMYLATEGLYAEITSSRSGITERLQNEHNILVAGPSTIMALLTSLSMGFKVVAINEKANEVRRLLAAAKTQYDKFGIILEKARKKISDAGKTLDEAQSRNAIIQKKLRNVEALDSASSENILELNIPDTTEDDYE